MGVEAVASVVAERVTAGTLITRMRGVLADAAGVERIVANLSANVKKSPGAGAIRRVEQLAKYLSDASIGIRELRPELASTADLLADDALQISGLGGRLSVVSRNRWSVNNWHGGLHNLAWRPPITEAIEHVSQAIKLLS